MVRPSILLALTLAGCTHAASSRPPSPPDLAELLDIRMVEPGIRLDIRYATKDNFTGKAVYPRAACYLKAPVAEALGRVHRKLDEGGLGLKVYDCYRPLSVQARFWKLVPDERYVADPKKGSRHNRGHAVDLTLVDAKGKELVMPTGYDDFSEKAHRDHPAAPEAAANSKKLEEAMQAEGFVGLKTEWWHFDYPGWKEAALLDVTFEQLEKAAPKAGGS